jgi:UDP-GlcNAc:undecaprenyl-phosphate/decaprenyl-phosphate GlcNAc-1-phosphate transferase
MLIKILLNYVNRLNLIDIPNHRSIHKVNTPRGGGIAFGFSFFISTLIFDFYFFINFYYIYLAIFLVFFIGIIDDYKNVSPKWKFIFIIMATLILYLNDIYISSLNIYLSYELSLGYFGLFFTIFALVGFTNALNLIDGIDGLASFISIIILSCFLYIGYINDDIFIIGFCTILLACISSFLFFNYPKATIFMGDSGSLFLGFCIGFIGILSLKYIHSISIFYICALPLIDTLVVMFRRVLNKRSPFIADKKHIHHILLNYFDNSVKKTLFVLVFIQFIFSIIGLVIQYYSSFIINYNISFYLFILFIIILALFYYFLRYIDNKNSSIKSNL